MHQHFLQNFNFCSVELKKKLKKGLSYNGSNYIKFYLFTNKKENHSSRELK